jgi:hypothetical protein
VGFYGFGTPLPNSAVRSNASHGNVLMTIKDDGTYKIDFLRTDGNFSDTVSGTCH